MAAHTVQKLAESFHDRLVFVLHDDVLLTLVYRIATIDSQRILAPLNGVYAHDCGYARVRGCHSEARHRHGR
jgi:hypothetical protein